MRISEFMQKEVVNISDGKCLGCINDLIFDECQGRIKALTIRGPAKYFHCIGYDSEYVVDWEQIVRIGPDVILVEVCADRILRKL